MTTRLGVSEGHSGGWMMEVLLRVSFMIRQTRAQVADLTSNEKYIVVKDKSRYHIIRTPGVTTGSNNNSSKLVFTS